MNEIEQKTFDYYCKHRSQKHMEESRLRDTAPKRMKIAIAKGNGSDTDTLMYFIEHELMYHCVFSFSAIIYMPNTDCCNNSAGKIIIEAFGNHKLYFEFKLAHESRFDVVKEEIISNDAWAMVVRYHNMRLCGKNAISFVQELLFADFFMQRFLMTVEPSILGSMTTQNLRSPAGQVFSFRQCVLKE